jgi:rhamnose transport system substrate-binding protein
MRVGKRGRVSSPIVDPRSRLERWFPNHEWRLLILLTIELGIFAFTAANFFTTANAAELARLSVEIGLLALAQTCVIVTGGIDLSVGSMMGLAAIVFGSLWHDARLPLGWSILLTLCLGTLGGFLNAYLITRLRTLPLIVTLGTFSLFRGLAEGLTEGIRNFTGFSPSFLFLGQGFWMGVLPPQLVIFAIAALGYWLLLERSVIGRGLSAIGFSEEGARYAGVPVRARLQLVYTLSGLTASLAAIIYVAHLGQAKSDAGTGYELMSITAVVLGGTSIFGGRGTIRGTLLGLAAIVVLQNGLRLSDGPAELAGVLTGLLLIATIGAGRISFQSEQQEAEVKNSQVAVLSAVIIAGALLVAGSNWWLVRSLKPSAAASERRTVIAMMPKAKGDPYFVSCRIGAEEAAQELNVELLWDGPTDLDPAKQNEVVEGWITRGVDVIAVSVENQAGISTVLRKARSKGIKVLTWDADAQKDARDFFINQATPQGIGNTLIDEVARVLHGKGEFAIVTASLSAANQNEWMKYMKLRLAEKYPNVKLAVVRPSDGDRDRAFAETQTILNVYPNVKVITGIAAPAVPGAAEAVKQSGRRDVKVNGLSLPNMCKPFVHAGVIDSIILWNTKNLGYLTVAAGVALHNGTLHTGVTQLTAGRLGTLQVDGDEVMLGPPLIFTAQNIDQFNF